MALLLKYGDIFKYNEEDYVYLSLVDDILYAARILSADDTQQLQRAQERVEKNQLLRERLSDHILYCFVILRTEAYRGRSAHFKGSEHDTTLNITPMSQALNQEDLKEMLDTIRESNALPQALKDSVADITLD